MMSTPVSNPATSTTKSRTPVKESPVATTATAPVSHAGQRSQAPSLGQFRRRLTDVLRDRLFGRPALGGPLRLPIAAFFDHEIIDGLGGRQSSSDETGGRETKRTATLDVPHAVARVLSLVSNGVTRFECE